MIASVGRCCSRRGIVRLDGIDELVRLAKDRARLASASGSTSNALGASIPDQSKLLHQGAGRPLGRSRPLNLCSSMCYRCHILPSCAADRFRRHGNSSHWPLVCGERQGDFGKCRTAAAPPTQVVSARSASVAETLRTSQRSCKNAGEAGARDMRRKLTAEEMRQIHKQQRVSYPNHRIIVRDETDDQGEPIVVRVKITENEEPKGSEPSR